MKLKNTLLLALLSASSLHAADWPEWGGGKTRNMVSEEKGLPTDFDPGKKYGPKAAPKIAGRLRPNAEEANKGPGAEDIDMSTTKNCLWVAKLGSQTYGTPVVANGTVYVGTNNESPRDPKNIGDRGIVMAFDEKTGAFKWQMVSPKMGSGKVNDWEYLGICASPTIVGNRAYVPSNRCQIVCLDVEGMANGNDGMKEEADFMAVPDKDGKLTPIQPGDKDADIIWVYDMYKELGVFQHNATSGYPLIIGDKLFAPTCNGVDWTHTNIPSPQSPSFIMLNANDGSLMGEMDHVASERVLHCSWSSPTYTEVNGKPMIIFAAGDGWVYAMAPETEKKDDFDILKEYWRYDANPPEYRKNDAGEPIKYVEYDGPSEIIATPVVHDGLVYVNIGQDPEHGEGVGMLSCIDPKGSGDISGKAVWTFKGIERSISTPAVKDGLVYTADYTGRVFCLDAKTGEEYWKFDTKGHIWASPLIADGKLYIGNEEGELFILAEGKELKEIQTIEFPSPLLGGVVAANGCLYVPTHTHLYCFKEGGKPVETAAK
ncbi:Outer membrane protein assembly factor BamB, contains PQQ-like beta-propeller repeat [Prosthecobacter debontii]|uniref:Outer membrane protein assembly factor BamB, contains PQQ-like beta-propeller repeat n=1 Tax=Prosthecobacter debontii TaxID=48467 RepID=A0A1T4YXI9_9BACT|nr:PQQ-binding-like beta-propeller repeat protein [Prosthecobacter debontii]SKB06494.1 Outer membrane protein assembly factor BamB, contains PQQ-like beta-propeller repeat [Prosthecobacter debontii]